MQTAMNEMNCSWIEWLIDRILFIVFVSAFLKDVQCKNASCIKSSDTVKIVDSCPSNKKERDVLATIKNCSGLALEQNCTANSSREFHYHCVINTFRNESIEVCARPIKSNGFCLEFNVVGDILQDHYDHDYRKCYDFSYFFNKSTPKEKVRKKSTIMLNYDTSTPIMQSAKIASQHFYEQWRNLPILVSLILGFVLIVIVMMIVFFCILNGKVSEGKRGQFEKYKNCCPCAGCLFSITIDCKPKEGFVRKEEDTPLKEIHAIEDD
ncbi:uncharacterized protein LOC134256412 isoform X2 [Saccostrea cucullata]|uniref:uncharacterized protein LOC134256412 isoform X2 n=1 Tax=Saccostrea cuccullata TaxID=36930 RepID=UPI002ED36DCF